jgi:hypothetical protein
MAFGDKVSVRKCTFSLWSLMVILVMNACNGESDHITPKEHSSIHPPDGIEWVARRDSFSLRFSSGNIAVYRKGMEGEGFFFKDGIVLEVKDVRGQLLLSLTAKKAITYQPYDIVSIQDFLWVCEDSTEISGPMLQWKRTEKYPVHISRGLELLNDKGVVLGSELRGDLLLRTYQIQHVESVMLWDAIAGGREGYQREN